MRKASRLGLLLNRATKLKTEPPHSGRSDQYATAVRGFYRIASLYTRHEK